MEDDVMVAKSWLAVACMTFVGLIVLLTTFGMSAVGLLRFPAFADRED
jgi:hypothetical protein